MADPKFFQKSQSFTLTDIAKLSGATLVDGVDGAYVVDDLAALDQAGDTDLSFLDNVKYKDQFSQTKAGACFVHPDVSDLAPKGVRLLLSPHPYKSYALAAQAFYPDNKPEANISTQAIIADDAVIGEGCTIESGVVIGSGVQIADGCWIEANTVIGGSVVMGEGCRIGSNATISHCHIGAYSRLYPGVRVGQDGFGFAIDPKGHVKVPQLGRVIIEEHVEIGANSTIDRGAGPDTVIGQGTWIDNLVQIGHNVKIGKGCIITAQVGISGSTVIEDFVAFGGQSGVAGHLKIGMGARIAAKSGVTRDVPAGQEYMGYPAIPMKQYLRQVALLKGLINKGKSSK